MSIKRVGGPNHNIPWLFLVEVLLPNLYQLPQPYVATYLIIKKLLSDCFYMRMYGANCVCRLY